MGTVPRDWVPPNPAGLRLRLRKTPGGNDTLCLGEAGRAGNPPGEGFGTLRLSRGGTERHHWLQWQQGR